RGFVDFDGVRQHDRPTGEILRLPLPTASRWDDAAACSRLAAAVAARADRTGVDITAPKRERGRYLLCRIPIETLVAACRCSTGEGAGYIVEMRRWRLLIHLRSSLWFIPVLCVVAGTGVAIGTI